jgi:hypothetical protein
MPAPETLTLRATAIAGQRYADDYAVIWRGMSVGRIMLGNGHRTTGPMGPGVNLPQSRKLYLVVFNNCRADVSPRRQHIAVSLDLFQAC